MTVNQQDILSLQKIFDCAVEVVSNDQDKDDFNFIVTCKDEAKLQFQFEDPEKLAVKFLESSFASEVTQQLEDKMNQMLLGTVVQRKLITSIRSVMKLLKDTVHKHAHADMEDFSTVTTSGKSNPDIACSSTVSEIVAASKKQKKVVLAANFSNQMSTSSSSLHGDSKALSGKKPPLKMAQDVINRIKWDKAIDPNNFIVGYEDRFVGIVERKFSDFDWDSELSSVGPDVLAIPQHRIHYFKYRDKTVWDKDDRLDNVFGSAGSNKTILDVMQEEDRPLQTAEGSSSSMDVDQIGTVNVNTETLKPVIEKTNQSTSQTLGKRKRPNYFVGFRVDQDGIIASVSTYMRQLSDKFRNENDRGIVIRSMSPLEKLHITLCICHLENDEDIEKVEEVLQQTYVESEALDIFFTGVNNFNRSVVFAQPHCKHIYSLRERLVEQLKEKEINVIEDFPDYKPHLTICQLPRMQGHLYNKMANFLQGKKSRKWKFGLNPQRVKELVLCKMGSTDEEGFYKVAASGLLQSRPDLYEERRRKNNGRDKGSFSPKGSEENFESKQRKSDVRLGMTLSGILRHNKMGFRVDSGGYVVLDKILKHKRFASVTKEDIYRVVANNSKKRFTIEEDENGVERIKANQGHSVEVEDLTLTAIEDPSEYPVVIHGTFSNAWSSIRREGLHRRKRIHIHMTTAEPTGHAPVISGMRKSCNVFIYVNIASAIEDGIEFFVSSNGVILSSGDEEGYLKPKYFKKVFGVKKNKRCSLMSRDGVPCEYGNADYEIEDENNILEELVKEMIDKVVFEDDHIPSVSDPEIEKKNKPT